MDSILNLRMKLLVKSKLFDWAIEIFIVSLADFDEVSEYYF